MKRSLSLLLALTLVFSMLPSALAADITASGAQSSNTQVTYGVSESYTVTVPEAATMDISGIGSITVSVSNAMLASNGVLNVYILGDSYTSNVWHLTNTATSNEKLAYNITKNTVNVAPEDIILTVSAGTAWNTTVSQVLNLALAEAVAKAGTYTDQLTFVVEYENGRSAILNEYGFYFEQPYVAQIDGMTAAYVFYPDHILMYVPGQFGAVLIGTQFTYADRSITIDGSPASVSEDGKAIMSDMGTLTLAPTEIVAPQTGTYQNTMEAVYVECTDTQFIVYENDQVAQTINRNEVTITNGLFYLNGELAGYYSPDGTSIGFLSDDEESPGYYGGLDFSKAVEPIAIMRAQPYIVADNGGTTSITFYDDHAILLNGNGNSTFLDIKYQGNIAVWAIELDPGIITEFRFVAEEQFDEQTLYLQIGAAKEKIGVLNCVASQSLQDGWYTSPAAPGYSMKIENKIVTQYEGDTQVNQYSIAELIFTQGVSQLVNNNTGFFAVSPDGQQLAIWENPNGYTSKNNAGGVVWTRVSTINHNDNAIEPTYNVYYNKLYTNGEMGIMLTPDGHVYQFFWWDAENNELIASAAEMGKDLSNYYAYKNGTMDDAAKFMKRSALPTVLYWDDLILTLTNIETHGIYYGQEYSWNTNNTWVSCTLTQDTVNGEAISADGTISTFGYADGRMVLTNDGAESLNIAANYQALEYSATLSNNEPDKDSLYAFTAFCVAPDGKTILVIGYTNTILQLP